jgi:hypothetical protein
MKKFFALFTALVLASSLFFVSCVVEEEQCEKDNIGTVKIFNESGESWMFDVTYSKDADGDWVTNEEVRLYNGESYTWDTITAGRVAIWTADGSHPWEISEETYLTACENYTFIATERCQLFNYTNVKVINETNDYLWVDVYAESWIEERFVAPGSSTTYVNVEAGDVKFASKYNNQSSWTFSDLWTITECEDFEFTWNAGKKASLPIGTKENVQRASKTIKIGSTVDFSDAPAK